MTTGDLEGALLLVGDIGSGKTHLLQQAAERSPLRTLVLRATRTESRWPLAGFLSMLALLSPSRPAMLTATAPGWWSDPRRASAVAGEALELIRALELSPTLVLIDDLHRMDQESQLLIGFICARLHGTGLRVIATLDGERPTPLLEHLPMMVLRPLDRDDLIAVALEASRPNLAHGPAVVLSEYAGGNPRVMLELIDRLSEHERSGAAPLRLPPRAGATADRLGAVRMAALSPGSMRLAGDIASAPVTRRSQLVAGDADLEDALQELLAAGIVEQHAREVRIRDGIVRSHLERIGSPQAVREHHRAAAERDDARSGAWHRSFVSSDSAIADHLVALAAALVHEGAVAAGVECAERARIVAEGEPFAADRFVDLAAALIEMSELALADRYLDVARQAVAEVRTQVRLAYLRQIVEVLRHRRLVDLDLDARLPGWIAAEPAQTAELLGVAAVALALRFEPVAATAMLERMSGIPAKHHGPLAASAASVVDTVAGRADEHSAPLSTVDANPTDLVVGAQTALLLGDFARARTLCMAMLERRPIAPIWSRIARHTLVETEIRSGRIASAHRLATEWARHPGGLARRTRPTVLDVWVAVAEDRLSDALESVHALLDTAEHDHGPALAAGLLVLRGELALLDDDLDEAMHALGRADSIDRALDNPALVRHLPDLVVAAVRSERLGEVWASIERFAERVERMPSRWSTLALRRIRAMTAEPDEGILHIDEMVQQWTPDDSPVELGRLQLFRAERLRHLGRLAEAGRSALAARDSFEEAGSLPWARYAQRRLVIGGFDDTDGVLQRFSAALTADERLILDAVREGLRTKEIASRLHLSVRAVELRLTRIYRVAGVPSRVELVRRLGSAP